MTTTPLLLDGEALFFSESSAASSALAQQDGPSVPGSVTGPAVPGSTTQGAPGESGGEAPPPGNPYQSLMMFALIGAVIWFLIFAPERKARKKREEMLGAVKKGDKVVTTGGLHAQVVEVKENEVTLKAGDVRLTFSRSSIHEVVRAKDDEAAE